jgi:hypothetical protein
LYTTNILDELGKDTEAISNDIDNDASNLIRKQLSDTIPQELIQDIDPNSGQIKFADGSVTSIDNLGLNPQPNQQPTILSSKQEYLGGKAREKQIALYGEIANAPKDLFNVVAGMRNAGESDYFAYSDKEAAKYGNMAAPDETLGGALKSGLYSIVNDTSKIWGGDAFGKEIQALNPTNPNDTIEDSWNKYKSGNINVLDFAVNTFNQALYTTVESTPMMASMLAGGVVGGAVKGAAWGAKTASFAGGTLANLPQKVGETIEARSEVLGGRQNLSAEDFLAATVAAVMRAGLEAAPVELAFKPMLLGQKTAINKLTQQFSKGEISAKSFISALGKVAGSAAEGGLVEFIQEAGDEFLTQVGAKMGTDQWSDVGGEESLRRIFWAGVEGAAAGGLMGAGGRTVGGIKNVSGKVVGSAYDYAKGKAQALSERFIDTDGSDTSGHKLNIPKIKEALKVTAENIENAAKKGAKVTLSAAVDGINNLAEVVAKQPTPEEVNEFGEKGVSYIETLRDRIKEEFNAIASPENKAKAETALKKAEELLQFLNPKAYSRDTSGLLHQTEEFIAEYRDRETGNLKDLSSDDVTRNIARFKVILDKARTGGYLSHKFVSKARSHLKSVAAQLKTKADVNSKRQLDSINKLLNASRMPKTKSAVEFAIQGAKKAYSSISEGLNTIKSELSKKGIDVDEYSTKISKKLSKIDNPQKLKSEVLKLKRELNSTLKDIENSEEYKKINKILDKALDSIEENVKEGIKAAKAYVEEKWKDLEFTTKHGKVSTIIRKEINSFLDKINELSAEDIKAEVERIKGRIDKAANRVKDSEAAQKVKELLDEAIKKAEGIYEEVKEKVKKATEITKKKVDRYIERFQQYLDPEAAYDKRVREVVLAICISEDNFTDEFIEETTLMVLENPAFLIGGGSLTDIEEFVNDVKDFVSEKADKLKAGAIKTTEEFRNWLQNLIDNSEIYKKRYFGEKTKVKTDNKVINFIDEVFNSAELITDMIGSVALSGVRKVGPTLIKGLDKLLDTFKGKAEIKQEEKPKPTENKESEEKTEPKKHPKVIFIFDDEVKVEESKTEPKQKGQGTFDFGDEIKSEESEPKPKKQTQTSKNKAELKSPFQDRIKAIKNNKHYSDFLKLMTNKDGKIKTAKERGLEVAFRINKTGLVRFIKGSPSERDLTDIEIDLENFTGNPDFAGYGSYKEDIIPEVDISEEIKEEVEDDNTPPWDETPKEQIAQETPTQILSQEEIEDILEDVVDEVIEENDNPFSNVYATLPKNENGEIIENQDYEDVRNIESEDLGVLDPTSYSDNHISEITTKNEVASPTFFSFIKSIFNNLALKRIIYDTESADKIEGRKGSDKVKIKVGGYIIPAHKAIDNVVPTEINSKTLEELINDALDTMKLSEEQKAKLSPLLHNANNISTETIAPLLKDFVDAFIYPVIVRAGMVEVSDNKNKMLDDYNTYQAFRNNINPVNLIEMFPFLKVAFKNQAALYAFLTYAINNKIQKMPYSDNLTTQLKKSYREEVIEKYMSQFKGFKDLQELVDKIFNSKPNVENDIANSKALSDILGVNEQAMTAVSIQAAVFYTQANNINDIESAAEATQLNVENDTKTLTEIMENGQQFNQVVGIYGTAVLKALGIASGMNAGNAEYTQSTALVSSAGQFMLKILEAKSLIAVKKEKGQPTRITVLKNKDVFKGGKYSYARINIDGVKTLEALSKVNEKYLKRNTAVENELGIYLEPLSSGRYFNRGGSQRSRLAKLPRYHRNMINKMRQTPYFIDKTVLTILSDIGKKFTQLNAKIESEILSSSDNKSPTKNSKAAQLEALGLTKLELAVLEAYGYEFLPSEFSVSFGIKTGISATKFANLKSKNNDLVRTLTNAAKLHSLISEKAAKTGVEIDQVPLYSDFQAGAANHRFVAGGTVDIISNKTFRSLFGSKASRASTPAEIKEAYKIKRDITEEDIFEAAYESIAYNTGQKVDKMTKAQVIELGQEIYGYLKKELSDHKLETVLKKMNDGKLSFIYNGQKIKISPELSPAALITLFDDIKSGKSLAELKRWIEIDAAQSGLILKGTLFADRVKDNVLAIGGLLNREYWDNFRNENTEYISDKDNAFYIPTYDEISQNFYNDTFGNKIKIDNPRSYLLNPKYKNKKFDNYEQVAISLISNLKAGFAAGKKNTLEEKAEKLAKAVNSDTSYTLDNIGNQFVYMLQKKYKDENDSTKQITVKEAQKELEDLLNNLKFLGIAPASAKSFFDLTEETFLNSDGTVKKTIRDLFKPVVMQAGTYGQSPSRTAGDLAANVIFDGMLKDESFRVDENGKLTKEAKEKFSPILEQLPIKNHPLLKNTTIDQIAEYLIYGRIHDESGNWNANYSKNPAYKPVDDGVNRGYIYDYFNHTLDIQRIKDEIYKEYKNNFFSTILLDTLHKSLGKPLFQTNDMINRVENSKFSGILIYIRSKVREAVYDLRSKKYNITADQLQSVIRNAIEEVGYTTFGLSRQESGNLFIAQWHKAVEDLGIKDATQLGYLDSNHQHRVQDIEYANVNNPGAVNIFENSNDIITPALEIFTAPKGAASVVDTHQTDSSILSQAVVNTLRLMSESNANVIPVHDAIVTDTIVADVVRNSYNTAASNIATVRQPLTNRHLGNTKVAEALDKTIKDMKAFLIETGSKKGILTNEELLVLLGAEKYIEFYNEVAQGQWNRGNEILKIPVNKRTPQQNNYFSRISTNKNLNTVNQIKFLLAKVRGGPGVSSAVFKGNKWDIDLLKNAFDYQGEINNLAYTTYFNYNYTYNRDTGEDIGLIQYLRNAYRNIKDTPYTNTGKIDPIIKFFTMNSAPELDQSATKVGEFNLTEQSLADLLEWVTNNAGKTAVEADVAGHFVKLFQFADNLLPKDLKIEIYNNSTEYASYDKSAKTIRIALGKSSKTSVVEAITEELTHAAMDAAFSLETTEAREFRAQLHEVWSQVRAATKDKHGALNPKNEKEADKLWNYMFETNDLAHKQEFLANMLSNSKVKSAFGKIEVSVDFLNRKPAGLVQIVKDLFKKLINLFNPKYFNQYSNRDAFTATKFLFNSYATLSRLSSESKSLPVLSQLQILNSKAAEAIQSVTNKIGNTNDLADWLRNEFESDETSWYMRLLRTMSQESNGARVANQFILLARKLDTERQVKLATVYDAIKKSFSFELAEVHLKALHSLLRTDIQALSGYKDHKLAELLSNADKRVAEIEKLSEALEVKIDTLNIGAKEKATLKKSIGIKINKLSQYLATGQTDTNLQALNAITLITRATAGFKISSIQQNEMAEIVDVISTLEAVHKTASADLSFLAESEIVGIRALLNAQKIIVDKYSKLRAEDGTVYPNLSYVKGYLNAEKNTQTHIVYRVDDAEMNRDLKARGYRVDALVYESFDAQGKPLRIHRWITDSYLQPNYNQGAYRMTVEIKDLPSISYILNEYTNFKKMTDPEFNEIDVKGHIKNLASKAKKDNGINFIPQYSGEQNDMTLMDLRIGIEHNEQEKLDIYRVDPFMQIAENLAHTFDITASQKMNKELVSAQMAIALKDKEEMTEEEFNKTYLTLSHLHAAPKNREMWDKMSPDVKDYLARNYGGFFYMRKDVELNMFGSQAFSIAEYLVDNITMTPEIYKTIRVIEHFIKSTVREIRKFIVLGTPVVLWFNTVSNIMFLGMNGLGKNMIRHTRKGIEEYKTYLRVHTHMAQLEASKINNSDPKKIAKINTEINNLQAKLESLTIYTLMKDGMGTSILAEIDNTIKRPQTNYEDRLDKIVNRVRDTMPMVYKVGREVLLSDDSKIAGWMRKATTASDLIARYVAYNNLMEKKTKQHIKENGSLPDVETQEVYSREAKDYVLDMFINYDLPDSTGIDYLNRMGAVMFTKYSTRIIRALTAATTKYPVYTAGLLLAKAVAPFKVVTPFSSMHAPVNAVDMGAVVFDALPLYNFVQSAGKIVV